MVNPADAPRPSAGRSSQQFNLNLEAEARRAGALFGQLAGWGQGLMDEPTLERRLQLDARERARLESKPPTGFQAQ
jgi:hypothetical protein